MFCWVFFKCLMHNKTENYNQEQLTNCTLEVNNSLPPLVKQNAFQKISVASNFTLFSNNWISIAKPTARGQGRVGGRQVGFIW